MALVAATVAFATLGVCLARNAGGAEWFIACLLVAITPTAEHLAGDSGEPPMC
jgi:hypothetical protein